MSGAAQSDPHPLRELASQLTIPAAICLCIVVSFASIALVAPWLAPYDEAVILTDDSFVPPGEDLLLGGDYLGRDLASRLVYGARVTLGLALAISALAFLLGSATGFLAAVRGGWVDAVLSPMVDALISFPAIMIALIVISGLGSTFGVLIVTVALIFPALCIALVTVSVKLLVDWFLKTMDAALPDEL